jgi:hypothetical protein
MALLWTTGYPKAVNVGDTTAIMRANLNAFADSTAFFVIVPHGATAPSFAQVLAGQNSDGTTLAAGLKGNIHVVYVATDYDMTASTLTKVTKYDAYFDASNTASGTVGPTLVGFTTAGATITSSPTLTATANTQYTYSPTADGTISSWSLVGAPSNMFFSTSTGVITWTPSVDQRSSGQLDMTATPTVGAVNTQSFTITVSPDVSIPSLSASSHRNNHWALASNGLPIGLTQTVGL